MHRLEVLPVTLTGTVLRLEPLELRHAPDLLSVIAPETLIYHGVKPAEYTLEGFETYIRKIQSLPAYCPFAQVLRENSKAVGITCFMDIRPEHLGLEIGTTWIGAAYQRTRVNPEAKYMLLRHAFEDLGAIRVQLKTDGRNKQSQGAIAKLGAKLEGTLRKHMVLPDGYVRDTVMFSILAEEWPAVKAGLEARLGYVPGEVVAVE